MAYFQNSETNEIYSLMPNEQVILGRDKYGLKGRYCSREHVKITLLEDGRCFVEKLTDHAALLNTAQLPLKKEIEAFNGDVIIIPNDQKIILKLKSNDPIHHITTICSDNEQSLGEISDESSLLGDY
ncbi:hypothetical protein G6F43_007793 [Rhizopus delemar]|nr:hypothetical protein G6F43_007793 [Rhizopus delemar]